MSTNGNEELRLARAAFQMLRNQFYATTRIKNSLSWIEITKAEMGMDNARYLVLAQCRTCLLITDYASEPHKNSGLSTSEWARSRRG